MPLNRYQIRNEYSLADPELYKSADKDDPEALLEGVAMAGLVGVLRQLGDLAEFAAEIFHDLHEEVMATAARGHSLTVRVQQLEADFPLIERAFLSQTNHSSFFYNAGTDWHPNQRLDQNMVTRGDLPRFVMDSYEECRGPPRLFLLDKFDVAGAGACLKRYTDPSFFKVETSSFAFTTSDVQREKKTRKTKKRGSRWRNGETPEVLPTSHAKLHQLFLEEQIEHGVKVPSHRVKLKRKMNGFPFDPKTGKSYMNKFLEATSPEHKVVHEICIDSSPLRLPSTDAYETMAASEEIRPPSPDKEVMRRKKIAFSSPSLPQSEESNTLKPCLDGVNEENHLDYGVREISRPSHYTQSTIILPSTHSVIDEKEIAMDGENQREGSDGYESDDVASEVDNYVDALATMDSELDTDSERKGKRDLHFLNSKRQVFGLSSSSDKLQAQSSDSTHSVENSTLSDDGNSYSKKEISSFSCSDSPSASGASILSESENSSKEAKTTDTSVIEETQLPQPAEHGDYDKNCIMVSGEPGFSGASAGPTTRLIVTDSIPMPVHNAGVFMEGSGIIAETGEKFVADDKSETPLTSIAKDTANLHVSPPGSVVILNDAEHDVDDSQSRASIEDKLADDLIDENFSLGEKVSYASYHSDVTSHASNDLTELPWSKSPKIQHETKSNNDHMVNNVPLTSELLNVPSQGSPELLSSDNQHLPNLNGEDPSLGEDSTCLHNLSDGATSIEDDVSSSLLAVNLPNHLGGVDNENSNGIPDASVQMRTLGASEKECQSWLTMSHDKSAEDMCMSNPDNLTSTEMETGNADEEHEQTNGVFSDAATFEQEDLNMSSGVYGPDFIDATSPQVLEIENDIQQFESGKVEISCSRQENLVEASSITKDEESDITETNELLSARASADMVTSPQFITLSKEAILSDETQNNIDRSDVTAETASFADSAENGDKDDLPSSLDHQNLSEKSVCLIRHSSQNEVELDHVHLPDSHAELKFENLIAYSLDSNSLVHDTYNYHHPESEVVGTLSDNKLPVGAENTLDLNAALSQSLDSEQVSSQRINVADSTEDASFLQIASLEEVKNDSEDNQLDEELLGKADVNGEQLPLVEQMQPPSHANGAVDASSQPLLANLPSHDAVPDVLAHGGYQDPQPSLTDYCAEEAESAIYEHDKTEALDSVEGKSEPVTVLAQPQQGDEFDLKQHAEASSISLTTLSPSQPPFLELLSQSNQDKLSSLPTHHPCKDGDDLECEELDKERLVDESAAQEETLQQVEEADLSNHADIVEALNVSSLPLIANVPCQPSVFNCSLISNHNVNPFEHGNIVISSSSDVVLLPGDPSIDLADMPPLPPLPPIQWRMSKLTSSPDLDGEPTLHHTGFNLSSLVPRTSQNGQPVNQNMALSAVATESSELIYMSTAENAAQSGPLTSPPTILYGNGEVRFIDPVDKHSMNSHFPLPGQCHEVQQPNLHDLRGGEAEPVNSVPNVTSLDQPSADALGSSEDIIQPRNEVAPELHSKEQGSVDLEGVLPIINGLKPKGTPLDTGLTDASESMHQERSQVQSQYQHHPLHQLAPETSSNKSNQEETHTNLERHVVTHGTISPPDTEKAKPDHSIPTTEAEIIWPAVEEGNTNGFRPVKLQRPRTPLIDDLATHDKSKLRKVTERVRPEIEKADERDSVLQLRKVTERVRPEIEKVDERDSVLQLRKVTQRVRPEIEKGDERDSLLEQIRKKSFNLKPAVATRPSIQGPQTNLRVAAILEKAKTIRQAFAGSDEEDDEDSWSDS